MIFTFKICQTVAGINNDQSISQFFKIFSFWRVFVIWPNSVVSTLTSNSCWYMFFFVLGSLTPLSLILLANSATGNRESIPRQYSSNVSKTNLYWFCKELWHFLAILGYILNIMLQFHNFQKLIKSCETATLREIGSQFPDSTPATCRIRICIGSVKNYGTF